MSRIPLIKTRILDTLHKGPTTIEDISLELYNARKSKYLAKIRMLIYRLRKEGHKITYEDGQYTLHAEDSNTLKSYKVVIVNPSHVEHTLNSTNKRFIQAVDQPNGVMLIFKDY